MTETVSRQVSQTENSESRPHQVDELLRDRSSMTLFIAVWAVIGFAVIATGVVHRKMDKKLVYVVSY